MITAGAAWKGWLPLLLLVTLSCRIGEVTATEGGDLLVVEGHLQARGQRQAVLLHRSLRGGVVRGEPGALVTITGPEGTSVQLEESPAQLCGDPASPDLNDALQVEATCYATATADDLPVRPGASYELEIISVRGERVRGRTTMPGEFAGRRPSITASNSLPGCSLPPRTNLELVWSVSEGAWSYLATLEVSGMKSALEGTGIEAPERFEVTGLAVSQTDTTLVLPAEFGLFELANLDTDLLVYLQGGFPGGVSARLRLSALDRNYVNAVRGGPFNPSGPIRISSVVGDGVGVFGSYVPLDLFIVVEENSPLPRC